MFALSRLLQDKYSVESLIIENRLAMECNNAASQKQNMQQKIQYQMALHQLRHELGSKAKILQRYSCSAWKPPQTPSSIDKTCLKTTPISKENLQKMKQS